MPLLDKLHRFTASHGALRAGRGLITGSIALRPGGPLPARRAGIPLPRIPDHAAAAPDLRRRADARAAVRVDGAGRCAIAVQRRARPRTLAVERGVRAGRARRAARRPQGAGRQLRRWHAVHRARLVHPRPAWLDADLRLHREALPTAPRTAGVPRRVADRPAAFHRQPPADRLRPARHQPARTPAVRLGRRRRRAGLGARAAVSDRAAGVDPGRRPGAVRDRIAPTTRCRGCGGCTRCITA